MVTQQPREVVAARMAMTMMRETKMADWMHPSRAAPVSMTIIWVMIQQLLVVIVTAEAAHAVVVEVAKMAATVMVMVMVTKIDASDHQSLCLVMIMMMAMIMEVDRS